MQAVEAFRAGMVEEAADLFGRVLEAAPRHVAALNLLAQIRLKRGNADAAENLLEQARTAAPGEPDTHFNLGLVMRAKGRRAEEIAAYRRAVKLNPRHANAWANLAGALCDSGEPAQALEAAQAGIVAGARHPMLLHNHGMALWQLGRIDEALKTLRSAIDLAPDFALAEVTLASCLLSRGRAEEAIAGYRRALELEPDNPTARDGLAEALRQSLPFWHFPMLADQARNKAYRRAIEAAVKPGMLVLDIGTGTGLLAMMAARAGAAEVVACEMDERLAGVAREIVARNGFAERIRVVARKSTDLAIGRDLPRRADLIVSEILDSALIGEGMLPTMRHALGALAVPGAAVIPGSATVTGALISVPRLRPVNPLASIEGFDLSPFDRFRNKGAGLPTDLRGEEHAFLSAPATIFDFDFTRPIASPRERTVRLTATAPGEAHALALWYELGLDGTVTASTGAAGDLRHWAPTLFFLDRDRSLAPGEDVAMTIGHDDGGWWFSLAKAAPGG